MEQSKRSDSLSMERSNSNGKLAGNNFDREPNVNISLQPVVSPLKIKNK